MITRCFTLSICLLLAVPLWAVEGIGILASRQLLEQPTIQRTVDDVLQLLQQACQCPVTINDRQQPILLILSEEALDSTAITTMDRPHPVIQYPAHYYQWQSNRKGSQLELVLSSPSLVGLSFGLYGLLQEQLWFSFYHPKQQLTPQLDYWPLTEEFTWEATPRFDKKGFHLHTMHPLELTEALLNPNTPNGIQEIKAYIDWLVRNQQNYMEFNLLESDYLEAWLDYIHPAVLYAQSRGILVGLDISLRMTQQKAFKLYRTFPNSLRPAKQQIAQRLKLLFRVPWNVIAMEGSTTEFTEGNAKKKQELQLYVNDLIKNTHGAHLAGRKHVVKQDKLLGKKTSTDTLNAEQRALDAHRAVFIHTVMFYGLTDSVAPVYENSNLLHLLDLLQQEQQQRETWYFPESAYWITFDNSIPMYLMPYLKARLDDILLMDSLDVLGHLTFSSGWEWGYWSIDWSIARWSWKHRFNGRVLHPQPTQYLSTIFHNARISEQFAQLHDLQQDYLKERQLIRYMVAQTVTDELPKPFNLEFHPRPKKPYSWWRKKASLSDLERLQNTVIHPLLEFAQKGEAILAPLQALPDQLPVAQQQLLQELIRANTMTLLRARHRAATLEGIVHKRRAALASKKDSTWEVSLATAAALRAQAQQLVGLQEADYRYPLASIARPLPDGGSTAYAFGYLYPVSNLHFWKREEEQIRQDKYGPFFMSIWDVPRILGIVE